MNIQKLSSDTPMKNTLTGIQINRLSTLLNVGEACIVTLHLQGIIDVVKSKALIIKDEYQSTIKQKTQSKFEIVAALSVKYKLSVSAIETIIYNRKATTYRCTCGAEITRYKHKKNCGKCDYCTTNENIQPINSFEKP